MKKIKQMPDQKEILNNTKNKRLDKDSRFPDTSNGRFTLFQSNSLEVIPDCSKEQSLPQIINSRPVLDNEKPAQ